MSYIEERQCSNCAFKSDRDEYPMCFEIEGEIITEAPVASLDERGPDEVVCTKYRPESTHNHPTLF